MTCTIDPDMHNEKSSQRDTITADAESRSLDPDLQYHSHDGYVLDAARLSQNDATKLSRDQRTILIPQPSDDPNDPLNWSQFRKNLILALVCACTFLPDYGSVTGAITLIPQAKWLALTLFRRTRTDNTAENMAPLRTRSTTPSRAISSWLALVAS